ncbi:hypothetical protein HDU67_007010 [Dinochytrium kinnereticum]|nr:hypothetical protein HDU67_007010 [Dinochytrium kinnereticum]
MAARRPESPRLGTPGGFAHSGSISDLPSARSDRSSHGSNASSLNNRLSNGSINNNKRSSSPGTSPGRSPRLSGTIGGGGSLSRARSPSMLLDLVCVVVGKPALSPPFTVSVFPDVTVTTFRELVGARLEASLKSRGLRHVDLDLFRPDHGPLTSDNPKLQSLAVSSHAFTPTEIRSVLPVTLITYNPSALMSEFFDQGQTFSSLNQYESTAVDLIVTVRRNAYNEARLNASLQRTPRAGPARNSAFVLDRPATTGGGPGRSANPLSSSPLSSLGPRPLTRPHSHSSLLARNPPPMTEIIEEDEVSNGSRRRSSSLSSVASEPRDLPSSKSGGCGDIVMSRKRSKSQESHRSCPETFGRPSRDWDAGRDTDGSDEHPFVPSSAAGENHSSPTPTRHHFGFNPFAGFARSVSKNTTASTAVMGDSRSGTPLSESGGEDEMDGRSMSESRQSTPVPATTVEEENNGERGIKASTSTRSLPDFILAKLSKGGAKKGEMNDIDTLARKRDPNLSTDTPSSPKPYLDTDEDPASPEKAPSVLRRRRRQRICLILSIVLALFLIGVGLALFFVWPRTPGVEFLGTRRDSRVEAIAGTSGFVGGPTFIAQFGNFLEFGVENGGFGGMAVRGVGVSGSMLSANGSEIKGGNFTGSLDGVLLPGRETTNISIPAVFTYTTFNRVNITGDQV